MNSAEQKQLILSEQAKLDVKYFKDKLDSVWSNISMSANTKKRRLNMIESLEKGIKKAEETGFDDRLIQTYQDHANISTGAFNFSFGWVSHFRKRLNETLDKTKDGGDIKLNICNLKKFLEANAHLKELLTEKTGNHYREIC